jgi:hypothetical protein
VRTNFLLDYANIRGMVQQRAALHEYIAGPASHGRDLP